MACNFLFRPNLIQFKSHEPNNAAKYQITNKVNSNKNCQSYSRTIECCGCQDILDIFIVNQMFILWDVSIATTNYSLFIAETITKYLISRIRFKLIAKTQNVMATTLLFYVIPPSYTDLITRLMMAGLSFLKIFCPLFQ